MRVNLKFVQPTDIDITETISKELGVKPIKHLDTYILEIDETKWEGLRLLVDRYETSGFTILVNVE